MPCPSLTVLMTVRNGMPYLAEAVRSLLRQDLRGFTLLIVNNGSTDGTREWLDALAGEPAGDGPKLRVTHLETNAGRAGALNLGFEQVDTELTAVLDADDVADPERLLAQSAFLHKHAGIDLLGSNVNLLDSSGNIIGMRAFPSGHEDLRDALPLSRQFVHSAVMFRTAAAMAAGGYPASFPYAHDSALWITMMKKGSRAASLPRALTGKRLHRGQSSRDLALLLIRAGDLRRLADLMLEIPGISATARQAALFRGAMALWRLGKKKAALEQMGRAFGEAPARMLCNHLLWRLAAQRLRRRWRGDRALGA